jgi:AcrR family transcriptional regulator
MPAKISTEERLVTAALAALENTRWSALTLADLAGKARLAPAAVYAACPSKSALIGLILRRVDAAALERLAPPDAKSKARDRAFDVILSWFEAMAPLKAAMQSIHDDAAGDAGATLEALPNLVRTAQWMADASGLPGDGWRGIAVTRGLALLLGETLGIWLKDGDDLAKTMAHIDRRLRLAEEWFEAFQSRLREAKPGD